jgi:hypothetical protein
MNSQYFNFKMSALCLALAVGLAQPASAQLAPAITMQPTSQTVFMDEDAAFQSAASGASPLRYQWYFNGTAVTGGTNPLLTLSSVQKTNEGSYFVIVSNVYNSATSAPAVLTVKSVPKFAFVSQGSGAGNDRGNGIAVDDAGNVYVTGTFSDTLTLGTTNLVSAGGSDAFMLKYDRAGHVLWAKRAGGPGNDAGTAVAVDPFGSVYFSGIATNLVSFDGIAWTNATSQSFMAKYDSSGALLWVRTNPPTSHLAFDKGGNIYLANLGPLFLDKYDSNGALLYRRWATHTPSQAGQPLPIGRGVAVDSASNVYVVASFYGSIAFTNTAETNVVISDTFSYRPPIRARKVKRHRASDLGPSNGGLL